ncbi:hypothetical protein P154DRAFT_516548 [Amniculicola lignicola CBS 123094]|uniref:RING-type E3 ubiquitin transferase n=1 Tax=Amniculicola lignicola CBS 123094 TaxID=1392246 RepID=A0A6A5X4G1_9PLEO|nr:hypothetical protein P154DRAFT_516548 [Amniculicola lignicola CBS 123094]
MSRLQFYVAGSAVLANLVLVRAYYERPNFYSAAVYISQSTGSLMFLINLGLIVMASVGYGLMRLFYGRLRPIETEQLYDKAWFAVSETLLAMTIFRDDIGIAFFAMFLCLLAGKVWGWIGEGRVEVLEQQPPANPRLFHTRLMSSLLLSVAFDIFMMQYCIDRILSETRPGVMVMFGFEYVLLAIASISILLRYTLSLVELVIVHRQQTARRVAREQARQQAQQQAQQQAATAEDGTEQPVQVEDDDDDDTDVPGWEEKGRWVFYLDLATDFIKSVVYLGFFMILMTFYGIPIHIMRDLFMTIRSFIKRCNDFAKYRNATRDMNARYPDATAEELERENTCIVCREEMQPWVQPGAGDVPAGQRVDERQRAKKLPCGHILHFSCLRSWLERQQVCPTCRRPVLGTPATQNNQQNNAANQGQQNPQNQPNAPQGMGIRNLEHWFQENRGNPQPNEGGQPGAVNQQAGNQNRPVGNFRVFNFGPLRIALGNMRLPDPQRNGNANNDAVAANVQQLLQNMNQANNQNQAPHNLQNLPSGFNTNPAPGSLPHNPADIQSDILRLQQNIIDSLQHLNFQHQQLEYIHALLGELNRLQQASGITAANGQQLPIIAPLNPVYGMAPMTPQAYFPSGPVLRQGDPGLPEGVVLPEGWTLRPMALAPQVSTTEGAHNWSAAQQSDPPTGVVSSVVPIPPISSTIPRGPIEPTPRQPSSPGAPPGSSPTRPSSSKAAEPSSLESSWSFGNVAGANEGEGSSSAVAGSSTDGQTLTRRTATVEDAEG